MLQLGKALAAKSDKRSSIPGTSVVEGETPARCLPIATHKAHGMRTCTRLHIDTHY